MSDKHIHSVAIHRACNLSFIRYQKLKSFFKDDWQAAFNAKMGDWQAAGIDPKGINTFFTERPKVDVKKEWETLEASQISTIFFEDKNYPARLKETASPPVLLFARGNMSILNDESLAVVGSRKYTTYGKRAVQELLPPIAQEGVVITSGLALGIDALAHQTALEHRGKTIAVLGNGIDSIYPKTNALLGKKILASGQGLIISEHLPGITARPEFFPRRNRIVAGLSKGVLVVEAAKKSGSLITAAFANDYNREVFAVPGEIFAHQSAGTNQIIADGQAHPALSGSQILEILGFQNTKVQQSIRREVPSLGEQKILALFGDNQKIHINDMIRQNDLNTNEISSLLVILEMKGWVQHCGGKVYQKT